ncbi:MAG TPA: WGxxGxxG family protein [Mycobacterium sp.]|jgi:hypothetical protein|uniref:WGxxGxxG family protein n=1 Tax=Mycobacterium sp. TaxID=1785 RepID=UPI002F40FC02
MRKTIATISATGALLFAGAGVANATVLDAQTPASTTTTLADNTTNANNEHSDKTGLWGLLGLTGLLGLAGLKRRDHTDANLGTTTRRPGV